MFPLSKGFLQSAFEQATTEPYQYLFINLQPRVPRQLRVRSHIMPDDERQYCYLPSDMNQKS